MKRFQLLLMLVLMSMLLAVVGVPGLVTGEEKGDSQRLLKKPNPISVF